MNQRTSNMNQRTSKVKRNLLLNKKGAGPIEGWLDYLLLFVIGLFGFIFLFTFLSFSLLFRSEVTIKTTESIQASDNLINQQKGALAEGKPVDVPELRRNVNYINTYKQPPEEIGLQSI